MNVSDFVDKWKASAASERANKDSFLHDLCAVLGVPHPDPKTGDPDRDHYVFERDAVLLRDGERVTTGWIDLYKRGCFILEAKQGSEAESKKMGSARRGTPAWNIAMQAAFGQALGYAATIEPPPPFVIITDIGYCFDLYAAFDGTRNYRKFPDALSSRIALESLPRNPAQIETLKTIFTDPHALDPSKRAARVTRNIAAHIATLARALEEAGHAPEAVAKFLMRCLFTMFAEDVELLPRGIFAQALNERWIENPKAFPGELGDLWKKMNEGGFLFGAGNIWRFNGGLFEDPVALPLTVDQLRTLALAAASNWTDVEPAIFGTLLERALSPKERHRLGAHYTPRAYVERLVRPTIEEPLRAEWDNVRAQVQKIVGETDPETNIKAVAEARKIVGAFYDRLTTIRVLDPACGSGNFLYVALDLFKRIENEVLDLLSNLGDSRPLFAPSGRVVSPEQFLGIEIKPWAKEITELVLWIGWLQWQIRTRGWKSHPQEPILRDYHNIECRDAVLAYDSKEPLLDDDGNPVTHWDGETMKIHPVTGEDVPDESAQAPVYRYVNPRKAEWPDAEFIVGNPPYVGNFKMKEALGVGYADALRSAYLDLPESVDLVMYWWDAAARLVSKGSVRRAGLITTTSITHTFNRRIVEKRLDGPEGVSLVFAAADHPWVSAKYSQAKRGEAEVRVAMSVLAGGHQQGTLATVVAEYEADDEVVARTAARYGPINANFTIGVDVNSVGELRANRGISCRGVTLHGAGFIVNIDEAKALGLGRVPGLENHIRPYLNGQDLASRSRDAFVIDLLGLDERDVRTRFPEVFDRLLTIVKPERDQNNRETYRRNWWLFGEPRKEFRPALRGLPRYIATPESARRRYFMFLRGEVLPDNSIVAIASDDSYHLGVLSSRVHVVWALATGGRLGVRHDPRYNKTRCFETFPFPDADLSHAESVRRAADALEDHRRTARAKNPALKLTKVYKALSAVEHGEELDPIDAEAYRTALGATLKHIHDDLDAAVFDAYGWPQGLTDEEILERLVALNAERAEEEKRGIIRWLRPEFQNPSGTAPDTQTALLSPLPARDANQAESEIRGEGSGGRGKRSTLPATAPWPDSLPQQIATVRDIVTAWPGDITADDIARSFKGVRKKELTSVLDSLAALGLVIAFDTPDGRRWRRAGA